MKLIVAMVLVLLVNAERIKAQPGTDSTGPEKLSANSYIVINQVGFYPGAPKVAILVNNKTATEFYVISKATRDTVWRGVPNTPTPSKNSSLITQVASFTDLSKTGEYFLASNTGSVSGTFVIRAAVHHDIAVSSLKGFYFQRVSMPLLSQYAGKWARPAGHPDTTVLLHTSAIKTDAVKATSLPDKTRTTAGYGGRISSPGGWYDAGDYNKYIVNSGITMGTLLSAYEDFSSYFDQLNTNIPESGNAIPDLLDEVLYNLRWMFTMQDPADGGVYHKCTNAAFDGVVMPGVTTLPRYVVQKSAAASLDFTAVMAQSARIFKKFNRHLPGLSDSCLLAAKKSWAWSLANPALLYNQDSINRLYEPKVTTGAYGDRRLMDEWFWAASELLVSTGDTRLVTRIQEGIERPLTLPAWSNVHLMGVYTLIRHAGSKSVSGTLPVSLIENAKQQMVKLADSYLDQATSNAFLTVMGGRRTDFNWGSNSNAANQGILMLNAWGIRKNLKYLAAALGNLDYLCGRNATGYCFITGFGNKSPQHPHHRPSEADGILTPVPGLLVGGPNSGMQDKCRYPFTEPETAYVDDYCSYASNEIAINWNAPLVYLANGIQAVYGSARGNK